MMSKNIFLLFAVLVALFTVSIAASSSMSCVYINGKEKCAYKHDPNGNMAGAAAGADGDKGSAAAGAGRPDDFDTDYQQIGNGDNNEGQGDGNGNYQPGGMYPGGGAFASSGGGFPNNQEFPQWNGNPMDWVNGFFNGMRGRR